MSDEITNAAGGNREASVHHVGTTMSDPTPQETASYQRGFHDGNAAAHGEIARLNAEVEQLRAALDKHHGGSQMRKFFSGGLRLMRHMRAD